MANQNLHKDRNAPEEINPYAVAQIHDPSPEMRRYPDEISFSSFGKSLLVWTAVCSLSAAPSFFWGLGVVAKDQAIAMVIGVIIFIGLYTFGDLFTRSKPFRKNLRVCWILRATFIVRSVMVVVVPIALFVDLWLGLVSVSLVQFLMDPLQSGMEGEMPFYPALITTLVQGTLLSVFLLGLGLIIWLITAAYRKVMTLIHGIA